MTANVLLPIPVIDAISNLIEATNRLGHDGPDAESRRLGMKLKDSAESLAIIEVPAAQRDVEYQLVREDEVDVILRLKGSRTQCWHAKFQKLTRGAQAILINEAGTPAAFGRDHGSKI